MALARVGAEDGAAKHPEWELILFIVAFGKQGVCYAASRFFLFWLVVAGGCSHLLLDGQHSSQDREARKRAKSAPHTPKRKRVAPASQEYCVH